MGFSFLNLFCQNNVFKTISVNEFSVFISDPEVTVVDVRTAEEIKIGIGSAAPYEGEMPMAIKGRHLMDGLPKEVNISPEEVREAIADPLDQILEAVRVTLERTPPELSADIIESGITLTGGGALLRGLDRLLAQETGMPVKVADEPLDCVALGAGLILEDINAYLPAISEERGY